MHNDDPISYSFPSSENAVLDNDVKSANGDVCLKKKR